MGAETDEDGAPQITEAMMDAGARVLWASGITDGQVSADRLTVAEIFRAMWHARLMASGQPEKSEN